MTDHIPDAGKKVDHIKAARQVWGESAILPLADLARFWAIAYRAGVESAKLGAAVPMPPEDWSVFNTGAEVASGLTWAEAWDYMTPSRIERGWTAVCVANKSNIDIVGKEGA